MAVGLVLAGGLAGTASAWTGRPQVRSESPVTPMDQTFGASHNSPVVLADPTEPRFVAMANRLDAPDFGCALQVSGDGGRGWLSANPVPELPQGADKCYAPEIAFDDEGLLYYLFVGLAGEGNEPMGAFLTTTADRGRTFTTPKQVLGPLNFGVRMALDHSFGERGRLHLVWLHASSDPPTGGLPSPPNPVLTAYSDDGGTTFSDPVTVAGGGGERVVAPALALGADRAVHVGWFDLGDDVRDYQGLEGPVWDGTWSLAVSSSSDGGRSFGPPVVVDDAVVPHERVMLVFTMPPAALVAHGPLLCAAWTDARRGDADAMLACSPDGGERWGGPSRLNDDPVGTGRWQYLPRLSVSPDGRLDAVFLDRRDDPNNRLVEVYATFSTDEGRTFAPNIEVSAEAFGSDIGQQYVGPAAEGLFEFGARLGLLSRRDGAVVAWPDTRNSRPGSTSQDLFAATLALPALEGGGDGPRLAGMAMVAVGSIALAAAAVARRRRPAGAAQTGESP